MSDIVERLRIPMGMDYSPVALDMERREAAAEIERLRAEVAELRKDAKMQAERKGRDDKSS